MGFGRATFFTTTLAGNVISVYQPGSIMWETAVNPNSPLAIFDEGGAQRNGPILGLPGCLFLAKFITTLVSKYNTLCKESKVDKFKVNHP